MLKKRYKIVFFIYATSLVLWDFLGLSSLNNVNNLYKSASSKDERSSNYWFSIYYNERYWFVDKDGKIYDVYQDYPDSQIKTSPFVSGINVNSETGELDKKMLTFIPKDIPKIVFEINLSEKYITTTKSAIIYLTDVNDIATCSSILRTVGEYLDSGKVFLFKNGKLYLL